MSQYQFRKPTVDPQRFGNGCRGKRRHPSKKVAVGAKRLLVASGRTRPGRINTYKCHACGHWHNGGGR